MQANRTDSTSLGRAVLTLSTLILGASVAFAGAPKISPDLQGNNVCGQIDVIVQFNQVPNAAYHSKILSRGGTLKRAFNQFKGGAYTIPASAVADLAADPDVVYISPYRPVAGFGATTVPAAIDYHPVAIDAPQAWAEGLDGSGVGVALIDSGIAQNSDLNAVNVIYGQDFTRAASGSVTDQFGHGTHVAGILAGNGSSSTGSKYNYTFRGIAENAKLINLRVLDRHSLPIRSRRAS